MGKALGEELAQAVNESSFLHRDLYKSQSKGGLI